MVTTFIQEEPERRRKEEEIIEVTETSERAPSFRTIGELAEFVHSFTAGAIERGTIYEAQIDLPSEVYLADVDEGLDRFRSELELAQLRNDTVVCASLESQDPVPIDSRGLLAGVGREQVNFGYLASQSAPWLDIDILTEVAGSMGLDTYTVKSVDARELFTHYLQRFIYLRFLGSLSSSASGAFDSPPLPNPPPGMLKFRVHTQKRGLRIRYCPAFLVSAGTVFGSPSTPVIGWLRPAAYIFGGEDSSGVRWDPGIYDLPPATEAHLVKV